MRAPASIALAAFVTALATGGCVTRPGDPDLDRAQRFVGTWMVEHPYHATYEGSVYGFEPDGSLLANETFTIDDLGDEYVTGSVGDPQSGIRCSFAHRWYSTDDATLVIDGNCSDGKYREIMLGFADDPTANTIDADVVVVSVGGEDGWSHEDWQWRWRRCESVASCVP
jgi:hypothetical protein